MQTVTLWIAGWLLVTAADIQAPPVEKLQLPAPEDVLAELNRLRADPSSFVPDLEDWLERFDGELLRRPGEVTLRTREGKAAVEEAIAFLKSARPAPALRLVEGMSRAARDHALDLGQSGATGHTGSDGSNPSQRLRRYGRWKIRAGENLAFGEEQARRVILLLLVDDGVPERSHRKSLLEPRFRAAGIACAPHPVFRAVCVIDLAGEFKEKKP